MGESYLELGKTNSRFFWSLNLTRKSTRWASSNSACFSSLEFVSKASSMALRAWTWIALLNGCYSTIFSTKE